MRTLIMKVDGEPEGKRKGHLDRPSALAFQRQVMDEMERYHRYPTTGPVALDLRFRAARRNPASIYNITKNTLDLLGPALTSNARPRRRSTLYRDDRQVKFLYVDLDQAWQRGDSQAEREGSTIIIA